MTNKTNQTNQTNLDRFLSSIEPAKVHLPYYDPELNQAQKAKLKVDCFFILNKATQPNNLQYSISVNDTEHYKRTKQPGGKVMNFHQSDVNETLASSEFNSFSDHIQDSISRKIAELWQDVDEENDYFEMGMGHAKKSPKTIYKDCFCIMYQKHRDTRMDVHIWIDGKYDYILYDVREGMQEFKDILDRGGRNRSHSVAYKYLRYDDADLHDKFGPGVFDLIKDANAEPAPDLPDQSSFFAETDKSGFFRGT